MGVIVQKPKSHFEEGASYADVAKEGTGIGNLNTDIRCQKWANMLLSSLNGL